MATRKAGLPEGFTFEVETPDNDAPVRSGDYLDEVLNPSAASTTNTVVAEPEQNQVIPPPIAAEPAPPRESPKVKVFASSAATYRTRINVTSDGRKRLGGIVDYMAKFGPEPDVRASEVIEALILAMYDQREHLDMSNVRRRGRYGSASHKNFPIALAESVAGAIATGQADKLL